MDESFEEYLERLKQKRTEDDYKYTDNDIDSHYSYIKNCYRTGLSVYKCLEFMWFETEEAKHNFKKINII